MCWQKNEENLNLIHFTYKDIKSINLTQSMQKELIISFIFECDLYCAQQMQQQQHI